MAHRLMADGYGDGSAIRRSHQPLPSALQRCHGGLQLRARRQPKPAARNVRADHHRYAARRSRRRLRIRAARNAGARRAGAGRRRVRPRVCRRADDAAVARDAADRPLSAGPRLARQRHARLGGRADAGHDAPGARLQDRGVRRRVSARPSVRPEPRLRRLRRPDPARPGRPARERAARVAGRRRSDRVAAPDRRHVASPTCPVAPACLPHLPPLPHQPSSSGSTSSNRTRRTAIRRPAGRCSTGTTTRSRPSTARSAGCSPRSGRREATRSIVAAGDHGEAFGEHGEYAHSIFVYDTTLRVPLHHQRPGDRAGARVAGRGDAGRRGADGRCGCSARRWPTSTASICRRRSAARALPQRELYARIVRAAASSSAGRRCARFDRARGSSSPRRSPSCSTSRRIRASRPTSRRRSEPVVARCSRRAPAGTRRATLPTAASTDAEAAERLRALGYSAGLDPQSAIRNPQWRRPIRRIGASWPRASRRSPSGELTGAALVAALEGIVRDDPRNGQAHLRLGIRAAAGRRLRARRAGVPRRRSRRAAVRGRVSRARHLPRPAPRSGRRRASAGEARRLEPDNPSVVANLGHPAGREGRPAWRDSVARTRRSPPIRTCTRRASTSRSRMRRRAAAPRRQPRRASCSPGCRQAHRSGRGRAAAPGRPVGRIAIHRSRIDARIHATSTRFHSLASTTKRPGRVTATVKKQGVSRICIEASKLWCCDCRHWPASIAVLCRTLSISAHLEALE